MPRHFAYQNFNCSLRDLCLNGKSLEEGCLLWTKGCALGRHCDVDSRNGSGLGRGCNLTAHTHTNIHTHMLH